jgi:hypothetical protein
MPVRGSYIIRFRGVNQRSLNGPSVRHTKDHHQYRKNCNGQRQRNPHPDNTVHVQDAQNVAANKQPNRSNCAGINPMTCLGQMRGNRHRPECGENTNIGGTAEELGPARSSCCALRAKEALNVRPLHDLFSLASSLSSKAEIDARSLIQSRDQMPTHQAPFSVLRPASRQPSIPRDMFTTFVYPMSCSLATPLGPSVEPSPQ